MKTDTTLYCVCVSLLLYRGHVCGPAARLPLQTALAESE